MAYKAKKGQKAKKTEAPSTARGGLKKETASFFKAFILGGLKKETPSFFWPFFWPFLGWP